MSQVYEIATPSGYERFVPEDRLSDAIVERDALAAELAAAQRERDHYRACWFAVPDLRAQVQAMEAARDGAYLRLQCADVPRDPWHWEVSGMLSTALETPGVGK